MQLKSQIGGDTLLQTPQQGRSARRGKAVPVTSARLAHDLAWHEGRHPLESWQFSTSLRGGDHHFSFRIHLLIVEPSAKEPQISIGLCLLDQDTGWIREVENTVPLKDILISGQALQISSREVDISGSGTDIHIVADLPDASIELTGTISSPVLVNNGEGVFYFLGAQHYKFSLPAIQVSGSVDIMGKPQSVTGAMWLNRQWGALPRRFSLDRNLEQRQWINLYPQLSNGIKISASQLWDFSCNRIETCCTVVLPDGTHIIEKIEPLDLNDFVDSRLSGRRYPRHVVLSHEPLETCLQISLPSQHREVVSKIGNLIKFDGKIVVDGYIYGEEVTGEGFVEMVGRWR
ncbi:lipocalin-like domain-containing protein [uncultured Cohaesibacter sp.]|uniref:lipocalin-like domain-containing protein n=1 Tax=uncultured Cohaesibacter sp. TaxID=1002546 RepID=UPI00292DC418|nr:lipocalin-like domain-containing protein [uncultured Cohaesibacter sp.]